MKKTIQLAGYFIALILLNSCYSSPDLSGLSAELVVATDVDVDVDFTDYNTYYLSDTIYVVSNSIRDDTLIVPPKSDNIIAEIVANMTDRGYTRSTTHSEIGDKLVDIAMAPSIIRVTNTGQNCWGWWGGYPGYWPPWGWGGYYPYCSYYKYDTGTMMIEMVDVKYSNSKFQSMWTSACFGIMDSNEVLNENRALRSIEQAFIQSPYIQK